MYEVVISNLPGSSVEFHLIAVPKLNHPSDLIWDNAYREQFRQIIDFEETDVRRFNSNGGFTTGQISREAPF